MVFQVQRSSTPYVVKFIVPLTFITIAAAVTYFIDIAAVPARAGFIISTLVATITMNFIISAELPRVSYLTTMDLYILWTFIYVLIALIVFIGAHFLKV
jgi:hypothetical protein